MTTFSTMHECSDKVKELCENAISACAIMNYANDYDRFCRQSSRIVFLNVVCDKYFKDCSVSYEPGSFFENGQRYTYKVIVVCRNPDMECFGMRCIVYLGAFS